MKPVRKHMTSNLRRDTVEMAYKQHPNSKSFDVAWIALGTPIYNMTWNSTHMSSLHHRLLDRQDDSGI